MSYEGVRFGYRIHKNKRFSSNFGCNNLGGKKCKSFLVNMSVVERKKKLKQQTNLMANKTPEISRVHFEGMRMYFMIFPISVVLYRAPCFRPTPFRSILLGQIRLGYDRLG